LKVIAWLRQSPRDELVQGIDLPFCRADLYYLTKLAVDSNGHMALRYGEPSTQSLLRQIAQPNNATPRY